jgi:hypothetical protein
MELLLRWFALSQSYMMAVFLVVAPFSPSDNPQDTGLLTYRRERLKSYRVVCF